MIKKGLFLLLVMLLLSAIACSDSGSTESPEAAEVSGPALVMFYTDN
jgi:hypothetical protein